MLLRLGENPVQIDSIVIRDKNFNDGNLQNLREPYFAFTGIQSFRKGVAIVRLNVKMIS